MNKFLIRACMIPAAIFAFAACSNDDPETLKNPNRNARFCQQTAE